MKKKNSVHRFCASSVGSSKSPSNTGHWEKLKYIFWVQALIYMTLIKTYFLRRASLFFRAIVHPSRRKTVTQIHKLRQSFCFLVCQFPVTNSFPCFQLALVLFRQVICHKFPHMEIAKLKSLSYYLYSTL